MSSLAVVLMGTVTGPDDQQRAIIYDKKERRQDLYQEGDFIYQAAIKKILRGKVIVSLNGKNEMLDISEARNVNIPRVPKPAVPQTVVQPVVSRPVGAAEPMQTSAATLTAPVPNSNVVTPKPASKKPLRSFRGGVIVKGRNTSGAKSSQ
jgi:type II secretory pathway component PulC